MKNSLRVILTLLPFLSFSTGGNAQSFDLLWAKTISTNDGAIAVDNNDNLYITGAYAGTVDFDPGPGTAYLTTSSARSYIAKYDAQGNYIFAGLIGSNQGLGISSLVVNNNSEICMAASYINVAVDLDLGPGTKYFPCNGARDFCVPKYDASGKYINAFAIGGKRSDGVSDIAVDAAGNMYVTGNFTDTVDFDPGPRKFNLISASSDYNVFVAKYAPNGTLIHAFSLPDSVDALHSDAGISIAVDMNNNIYIGGVFHGTIDLNPGAGSAAFTSNGYAGFVAKYDAAGNYLWGGSLDALVKSIALDSDANLYVTGPSSKGMDVDLDTGEVYLPANGDGIFLAKYTASGSYVYARSFRCNYLHSIHNQYGPVVAINRHGHPLITGVFKDSVDFDPLGSGGLYSDNGATDIFVAKFNENGNFTRGMAIGAKGGDRPVDMVLDGEGNMWLAGMFSDTVDFDPGPGSAILTTGSITVNRNFFARYTDPDIYTGISDITNSKKQVKIYSAAHHVVVDFTSAKQVDAKVKVIDMLGRIVTEAECRGKNIIRLRLPDAAPQVYAVIVQNAGIVTTEKVWVE